MERAAVAFAFFVFAPFGQAVSCDVLESLGRSSVTGPLSGTVVRV